VRGFLDKLSDTILFTVIVAKVVVITSALMLEATNYELQNTY